MQRQDSFADYYRPMRLDMLMVSAANDGSYPILSLSSLVGLLAATADFTQIETHNDRHTRRTDKAQIGTHGSERLELNLNMRG